MGNFGKRLLIITLSLVAVVALAIVGNSIQQSERLHKVSDSSNVVYGDITKGDLWDAIINSSITDTINESLNYVLLKDVISTITDEEINSRIEEYKFGDEDLDSMSDVEKQEHIAEHTESYNNKMYALGYYTEDEQKEYIKLLIAKEKYAYYRANNELAVGDYDMSKLNKENNKDDWEESFNDEDDNFNSVYAVGVFFNSSAEEKKYILDVADVLDNIVFDSTGVVYKFATKNSSGNPYLTSDYSALSASLFGSSITYNSTYECLTTTGSDKYALFYIGGEWYKLLIEKSSTVYEYLNNERKSYTKYEFPLLSNASVVSSDNNYTSTLSSKRTENKAQINSLKDDTNNLTLVEKSEYQILSKVTTEEMVNFYAEGEDEFFYQIKETTLDASNNRVEKTYVLRYVEADTETDPFAYGKWYKILVETKESDIDGCVNKYTFNLLDSDNEVSAYVEGTTTEKESDVLEEELDAKRELTKTKLSEITYSDYTKVNMEYTDVKAKALDQTTTFSYREVGNDSFYLSFIACMYDLYYRDYAFKANVISETEIPKEFFDASEDIKNKLMDSGYLTYKDGDNYCLYKYIKEDSKLTSDIEYTNDTKDDFREATLSEKYYLYCTLIGGDKVESLLYTYEDYSTNSSTFATVLFDTYKDKKYSDLFKVGSSSPYYLIYRITDSTKEFDADEYRKQLIDELLDNEYFVEMCIAELRKEAKYTLFDQYLVYAYQDDLEYNSSYNKYGVEELDDIKKYYTKGLYSTKYIARINGVSFEMNEDKSIKSCTVSKKLKDRTKLTCDQLYDYAMNRHGASYIAQISLNKTLKSMNVYTKIHGTDSNYLTSDNWRMTQYKNQVENLNYYYELAKNYPAYASYYGLGTYASVKDYLYTYIGVRSWDRLVSSYMTDTVKYIYLYNKFVNDDFESATADTTKLLKDYIGLGTTQEYFNFKDILEKQFSIDSAHFLIYVDINNDTYPDDFNLFKEKIETGNKYEEAYNKMSELYDIVLEYVSKKASYSKSLITNKSTSTAFNSFVTEYNDSTDSTYKAFKDLGIKVKYEALGTITDTTVANYDAAFGDKIKTLNTLINDENSTYNDVVNYYFDTELTDSAFGKHLIIVSKTDDYEKIEWTEQELLNNVAKYLQVTFYESIFGSTDNPEENSRKVFENLAKPSLDSEVKSNLTTLFEDELDYLTDSNASYMTTYLALKSLSTTDENLSNQINCLISAYEYTLFED